jgi:hypothetical protein
MPGGTVVFAIDIKGRTGTFSYGPSNKPPLSYPVEISTNTGWEGEWVYFKSTNSDHRGSLDYFNGLLSTNGRTLTVRPGVGIGDCRGFSLVRSAVGIKGTQRGANESRGSGEKARTYQKNTRKPCSYHGDSLTLCIMRIDQGEDCMWSPYVYGGGYCE